MGGTDPVFGPEGAGGPDGRVPFDEEGGGEAGVTGGVGLAGGTGGDEVPSVAGCGGAWLRWSRWRDRGPGVGGRGRARSAKADGASTDLWGLVWFVVGEGVQT